MLNISKLRVDVTAADIAKGRCNSERYCPIARSVRRQLSLDKTDILNVYGHDGIELLGASFKLPRSAQRFVKRFDNKKPVKPFTFVLRTEE